MTPEEVMAALKERGLEDVIELIEDAKAGEYDELEVCEPLGLLMDRELNDAVISLLESLGITIIYVNDDEGEDSK